MPLPTFVLSNLLFLKSIAPSSLVFTLSLLLLPLLSFSDVHFPAKFGFPLLPAMLSFLPNLNSTFCQSSPLSCQVYFLSSASQASFPSRFNSSLLPVKLPFLPSLFPSFCHDSQAPFLVKFSFFFLSVKIPFLQSLVSCSASQAPFPVKFPHSPKENLSCSRIFGECLCTLYSGLQYIYILANIG